MDEEGGEKGGGGGGENKGPTQEEITKQIADAVEAATAGLKNKNTELLGSLRTSKDELKVWEGFDAAEVKNLLSKIGEDEDAVLIKEGKIEEVITKRTEKRDAEWKRKVDDAEEKVKLSGDRVLKFMDGMLSDKVRAAVTGKVHDGAIDDALLQAKIAFSLDEEGNAIQMSGDSIVIGKDGKTPFSIAEWIEGCRETKPHWFPANGGGTGSKQSTGPVKGDLSHLSPQQRMTEARKRANG